MSRVQVAFALALLAFAVIWHGWWVTRCWNMRGLSGHEFRQSQTAVGIRAMKQDGFRIDYSTPVLGKPWSIPFEFPIYQGLAAFVSQRTGLSVVQSGRWVTLVSFYLALPAIVLLLRRAGFSVAGAVIATIPVLFAPVYVLYSRAVLIEATAFCASAWFLWLLMSWRAKRSPALLAATLTVGTIAVLTKATTWAAFSVPWAACFLVSAWRSRKHGWRTWLPLVDELILVLLPLLLVGFGWVWITDRIKEMNPIGAFLMSEKLVAFYYGTLAQKTDPAVYRALWNHWNEAVMPGWVLATTTAAVLFVPKSARSVWALGALAFLSAQAVFFNLYALHDYYFYANAAGACVAAGATAAGFWDAPRRWYAARVPAIALLVAICAGEFIAYRQNFYGVQIMANGGNSVLSDTIKQLTNPNDVIVVHSPDWSSILGFQSERRMMMIPDSQMFYHADAVQRGVNLLRDENVPLVIFRDQSRLHIDWRQQRTKDFNLDMFPLFTCDDAIVFARRDLYASMRRILKRGSSPTVILDNGLDRAGLKPAEQVAGTPKAAELTNMDPVPASVSTPYYGFRYVDGLRYFFAHPPSEIVFDVPSGASRVELGYRIEPHAYEQKDFDGAYVSLGLQESGAEQVNIHQEWLTRDGAHGPRHVVVPLPKPGPAKLVLQTLTGPMNNAAYDWVLIEYLRIK